MDIITLTDIHGYAPGIDRISDQLAAADLVVLAGDITQFGGTSAAKRIIHHIRKHTPRILAVSGNCDYPEVEAWLNEEGLSLHCQCKRVHGIQFTGIGGSLPCPGLTPNEMTENQFKRCSEQLASGLSVTEPHILVTHQPPFQTMNDTTTDGNHVGSQSIRQLIEDVKPMMCITGHIHEGAGIDTIGSTRVFNPGPFFGGYYGCITIGRQIESMEIRSYSS